MASRNPDLRHHGTGNRKRKQCKNALRYPGIKKNFQKQQLKTILKQLTTCLTHLHCSLLSGFDLLYTLVDFFLKGDTVCYIHPVSTAAEARSARKRALDRKRAEACDTPATLNRCGHFDKKYVASLKGTCRLFTFVRSFCLSYFFQLN
jgi:hypothetical protein